MNAVRVLLENAVNVRSDRDFAVQISGEGLSVKAENPLDIQRKLCYNDKVEKNTAFRGACGEEPCALNKRTV